MNPISTSAMRIRMMRAAIVKKSAMAAALRAKAQNTKPVPSLKRITAVHKSVVQILPKRNLTLGKSSVSMKRVGSNVTSKPNFKMTRPVSLRSPIKPRVAKKKLVCIKPAPKPKGRHMDLTQRGLKKIQGFEAEFGPIFGEFAGAKGRLSPFAIYAGNGTGMSVPVDRPLDDPPRTARMFISGIPAWLDPAKVYYDLLVFLAQHHLVLSTLDFTSHAEEGHAAWASVTLSFEAEQLLKASDNSIQYSVHRIFSIPESIRVTPRDLLISLVEDVK